MEAETVRDYISLFCDMKYPGAHKECIKALTELERLADIGRATEKAYKEDILLCEIMPGYEYNEREVMFKTIEELLEWAKGGK